ncbi:MAG: hypothetical protein HYY48_04335 [Gammaproteobacteria bacterium]|nr:hypothetical protein [Gammaproteobacteria bacterium]
MTPSRLESGSTLDLSEPQIAALLECHYGDGMVYLPHNRSQTLYGLATQRGFIDAEGYLTRKGRALLARYHYA